MFKSTKGLLTLFFISLFISLFLILSLEKKEQDEFQILSEASLLLEKLNSDILMLRRHEKDFLSRKNNKYIILFNKAHRTIQTHILILIDDLQHEKIDSHLLITFRKSINRYADLFNQLALKQETLGYHESESKHLEVTLIAKELQTAVQNNKELNESIHSLVDHENNFILQRNMRYKDFFIFEKSILLKKIKDPKIKILLDIYTNRFLDFVQTEIDIGLNENLGLHGKMRTEVHESEDILVNLSKQLTFDLNAQSEDLKKFTHLFTFIIFVVMILISIVLVRFFMSESKVDELIILNKKLKHTLDELEHTQDKLIESEKMASLGSIVAGVAHEINTPLGIALTGITYFDSISLHIRELYTENDMSQDEFETYLNKTEEISEQIVSNITRASNLVQAFKQISVDQTHEEKRRFYVKEYTDGLILSISSQIKKTQLIIHNNIPKDVKVSTYPGAFGQVITNLIMNSILHGYINEKKGHIHIELKEEATQVVLSYKDDGKGINPKELPYIFDAFFTTKKSSGGTGLGLNILYNIVQKQFKGEVSCTSEINKGVHFTITIPSI
ncbi:hypothetical protein A9Q76_03070 [Arcobacter sp. 31_11_sub10_T18]|nr:hypothetical protein A9Q76_03070 [Arcobacter sp. 31_11_sub10_T18]